MGAVPHELVDLLGADAIIAPDTDLSAWEAGVRDDTGTAAFVMRPADTDAVAAAVACCIRHGIPFVPQSGNTGLVGGSTPDASGGQAVLSLERLNRVCDIDVDNRSVRVGAGMRLSELNARLEAEGLCFPVDLGADPMIGGMVATNTGGARFLRYGDVRANTLGLTVVLPDADGTVLRLDRALRKDNTGPDWKQLFIGTSGAFGIVTECVLNVEPLARARATAILVPRDETAIFDLLRRLETRLGTDLSAFEFMSGNAMRHALAHAPSVRNPFSDGEFPPIALLVEIARTAPPGAGEPTLSEMLEYTLAEVWEQSDEPLRDALFGPPEELWPLRHALSEGVKHAGHLFAFDLAFTRPDVMRFRASMAQRLVADWPELEVCDFGHVGDGGIHFNLVCHDHARCQGEGYERALRDAVVQHAVEDFGGSFSGEHAIGRANQRYYDRYTPDALKT
ncbi:MAG: FAD-binding oxidoreductase, partial [Halofilum sp. (in: g-proteobacteria)]